MIINCDECGYEFSMSSIKIEEAIINIKGKDINLLYFACSKCNKIYRIALTDKLYEELRDDLERTKRRIRKNYGSGNDELARTLDSMVNKKHERLRNHLSKLDKKYPGTFTFVVSENNHEEKIIKYLP